MSSRRDFITLLGGAAAAWPMAARAQQPERIRVIGVLISTAADDPEGQARIAAFRQGLQELGWAEGRNVRIDTRAAADGDQFRTQAAELVALASDVILAATTPGVAAVQHATRTVPVVFVTVFDPVSAGFVSNLARPGGNTTGFALPEYGTSVKWLELLKEIAPGVTRVAVVRDPALVSGTGQLAAIQAVAPSFSVELNPVDARDPTEMERAIAAFARSANGGLIVTASPASVTHRKLIIALAARHRLPAVYAFRFMAPKFIELPDIGWSSVIAPVMPNGRSHASPSGRSPKPLPKKIPGWSKSGALALMPRAPECPIPHPNRADTNISWRSLR
jgi:putative ABC transport system substrate-binding protein